MSFPNYDNFQGQPSSEDGAGSGAPSAPPQQNVMGQQHDSNAPFPGGSSGAPGSAGGDQPGIDPKTTLWYGFFITLTA